jgi:alanyl-tRNA synthetase
VEVFLDQTPFYAEGGGQVGDTGTITTETGRADVYDTVYALPGLIAHKARLVGELTPGQDALAGIDGPRREAIRRNHTATHLLHAALRTVLGDHVRQQGSLVAPDRLRFDFSHHGQPTPEELATVFSLANDAVLTDEVVETTETSREEAERMGAVAFFGDKYGSTVRVVRAGDTSLEFCGGTHVSSLGQIGPISLLSEESIGSNKRRIFAVTGRVALDRAIAQEELLHSAAELLRTEPDELLVALERVLTRQREGDKELAKLRQQSSASVAAELAAAAENGVVVARHDGVEPDALRGLTQAVLRHDGVRAVALGGSPDGSKVALAVATGGTPDATVVVRALGAIVGGGGGGSPELALAGGKDPSRVDEALAEARRLLSA